jgi:hypothetical protein
VAKDPSRLRATSPHIQILEVSTWNCKIERFTRPGYRIDRITIKELRRRYTLQHEQEKLL